MDFNGNNERELNNFTGGNNEPRTHQTRELLESSLEIFIVLTLIMAFFKRCGRKPMSFLAFLLFGSSAVISAIYISHDWLFYVLGVIALCFLGDIIYD